LRRVWFQDLSAGPDFITTSWALDAGQLPAGTYTVPSIWEYGNLSAYRPFTDLSRDLSKVTRYVALDCLFTTSPVFSPALSPPTLPQNIDLDVNFIDGVAGYQGSDFINFQRMLQEEHDLRPYNDFSFSSSDHSFSGGIADAYRCFRASFLGSDERNCNVGAPSNDPLYWYLNSHILSYVNGKPDYQVPIFSFFVPDDLWTGGLRGVADDNLRNGIQSYVYIAYIPSFTPFAGNTNTTIHEVGHHLGARHPHDGFDYESFQLISGLMPEYTFIWGGDASDSVMSYIGLSNNFSQFDRDNMDRWMTAVYINQANLILGKIVASPQVSQVAGLLSSADADATTALTKYNGMDYLNAVISAKSAYNKVLTTAADLNIRIEPNSWPTQYKSHKPGVGLIETRRLPADYPRDDSSPALFDRPSGQQRPNLPLANDQFLRPIR
jgi:hypothetical protein